MAFGFCVRIRSPAAGGGAGHPNIPREVNLGGQTDGQISESSNFNLSTSAGTLTCSIYGATAAWAPVRCFWMPRSLSQHASITLICRSPRCLRGKEPCHQVVESGASCKKYIPSSNGAQFQRPYNPAPSASSPNNSSTRSPSVLPTERAFISDNSIPSEKRFFDLLGLGGTNNRWLVPQCMHY